MSIDGLLKNGRIGRDARQAVMVNQTRQSTGRQQAAVDVIEPDALAERLYSEQRVAIYALIPGSSVASVRSLEIYHTQRR